MSDWLYEVFLDEEMKTSNDYKRAKTHEEKIKQKEDTHANVRDWRKDTRDSGGYKPMGGNLDNARKFLDKSREDISIAGDQTKHGQAVYQRAVDAVDRHDRRHPDRKLVESFDVAEME